MTKPRVAFVVAVARNRVIGRDGHLPWRMSSDLKRFKSITMGKPVVMGRKTWEGLPRQPLPGRLNIVVTHQRATTRKGRGSYPASMKHCRRPSKPAREETCVIGGGEIFRELMPRVDRLYLSEIDLTAEGDTLFPCHRSQRVAGNVSREVCERGTGDDASFILRVLDRRAPVQHG